MTDSPCRMTLILIKDKMNLQPFDMKAELSEFEGNLSI